MGARNNIDFLKNRARFPKVEVTPLSVPTVQVGNTEWNRMVNAMDGLETEKVGFQVERGVEATAYEAYHAEKNVAKGDLPSDVLYSTGEAWANVVNGLAQKAPLVSVDGKNKFNKNAARATVTASEGSSTGYVITDSEGNVEEFVSHSSTDTTDVDGMPDENIYGAYFHQYFGWIYDAALFTSHKIAFDGSAMTATFFNGGIPKTILAFDAEGNYLGYVVTSSTDWAHVTMAAASFTGVAYVRVSNCVISSDPNVVQVEKGTEATAYEAYISESVVPKTSLPHDTIFEADLVGKSRNEGAAKTLKSGMIDIVAGHYDTDGRPVTGSGSQYISDYVPIYGALVYEFAYINAIHFYDGNKNEVQGTTKDEGFAYKAPENARYMSVSFNGVDRIGYTSTYEENYASAERSTDLNLLPSDAKTVDMIAGAKRHRATYIIGDSEAAAFHHYVNTVGMSRIVSSFGGHTTDLIATNVGQGTGGIGSLGHLKGANVIVVAGTNDQASGQDGRLIAYHRELLKNLRAAGANEIFAISPFWDITKNPTEMRALPFVGMLKRLYGGHYIDVMEHVLDCGEYYNPYHPAAFTQPSVGGSVTLSFEDVDALTECGMIAVGDKFWIRYYDDKADLYQCTGYSTTNNTVTAKLVTNGSDVAPGDTGGKYTESVSTTAWTGTKTTIGWVLNEEDATRIGNGQIPACIYADRGVHFGKILARIIEDMLGVWYDVNE